jgi:peptidoglycan/xylan/chitin deacetylase (PgdA/CDA1 family)
MDHLAENCTVIDLDHALRILAAECLAPPNPVVLTFDDGTPDFVEQALPVLAARDFPVTLYLATGPVDEGRAFWHDGAVLTWKAMEDAVATGLVTVGSHTHSHRPLDSLTPVEAEQDLRRATGLIEDHLGLTPRHFAYPKAIEPTLDVEEVVRAQFDSAALEGNRANVVRRTDPFLLARSPIQISDGDRFFRHKAAGGLRLEATFRGALRRRRR